VATTRTGAAQAGGPTNREPRDGRPAAAAQPLALDLAGKEPDDAVPALVEYAARLHVSDLFLATDEDRVSVFARHLGILRAVTSLSLDVGRRCISYIKTMADMNISEHRRPMDGRWLFTRGSGRRLDLRINTLPTLYGEDCTVRVLDQEYRLLALDQLGFDTRLYNVLAKLLTSPTGLFLVTGPTETGKSTTLYAGLSFLNNGERKINTIEDPIEYSLRGIRQSQVNGNIALNFDELLRHVLRQTPDVIMIGEIRDAETALTAVRAAASGHLVLSTLHAPVAAAAIHTLLRLGVNAHLLSSSLLGVMSQRLLRTLCPRCKAAFETPAPHVFEEVRHLLGPGEGRHLYAARGCPACHMTGYAGRTGVFELLEATPEVRDLVDAGAHGSRIRQTAVEGGMVEFKQSALVKVARGETTIEEVLRVLPSEYLTGS
jgi:type II secretory ATPase GspE/PulE/Tfp pilus assembly ATPase PilB-like protein